VETLPLPPRPNLQQYRKRAKDLVKASLSQTPDALDAWAREWLEALARLRGEESAGPDSMLDNASELAAQARELAGARGTKITLAEAQRLIARAHGFSDWAQLSETVAWIEGGLESVSHRRFPRSAAADAFETAVDALLGGDVARLRDLLERNPDLIRARSARAHRATLLHYVAANGVERQRTPPNAVEVARLLLEAGAEVDASANTYSGGNAQTTMNLLVSSVHPASAGLQEELVELLLDFGAAIDGVDDDGSPLMTALAFGYGSAAATLARRGARIDNVVAAAALGRIALLERLVDRGDSIKASLAALYWIPVPVDRRARLGHALSWAAAFGEAQAVELLLDRGVDPAGSDRSDMTALHWAAANRHLQIVGLLLERGAPLEGKNTWGGTVLASTAWFVANGSWFPTTHPRGELAPKPSAAYAEIVEALLAAGADVGVLSKRTGDAAVDEVLKRHGGPGA
jgi:ankyrin repeat protein